MHNQAERELDVIVWGATGFTGRLVAAHLLARYGAAGELRWALGGRNESKLEKVRAQLGSGAEQLPLVLADASDRPLLDAMAARARVICSTVGPYALHGSHLVAACVDQGTHYCDLTGEVHWMRRMIDAHHDRARDAGTRIVHTCGFDSIPSDLGTLFVQREMQSRWGVTAKAVKLRAGKMRGGFSGGTIASMLNVLEEAKRDPSLHELLADPYALNPEGERSGLDRRERVLPRYDRDVHAWVAPFVMAPINTKVVRRSNALLSYAYGRDFRYEEGMVTPLGPWGLPLAAGVSAGSAAINAAFSLETVRHLLARKLPQSGEGPSAETLESGFFDIELIGKAASEAGEDVRVRVHGDGDPGYTSTSRMLGEAAVCLAKDELVSDGGVLTPAVAMGEALLARLPANAAVTFSAVEPDGS